MPVTIRPTSNPPRVWNQKVADSAEHLFQLACHREHQRSKRLIQSSFSDIATAGRSISPSSNGLVRAAFHAYAHHHHLTIRPEDVWFTILSQLSFYIGANAEDLRDSFVAHEGKQKVVVKAVGTIDTIDFGELAVLMTGEMDKHIVDKGLKEWILPDFTTTTPSDTVTASVLMMGALQSYFEYSMMLLCGIPSVTLLGERDDWVSIQRRLDRFDGWGEEAKEFAGRLKTVLRYLVRTFDEPDHPEVHEFWSKIAHHESGGSGPTFLSGWMTAFCYWTPEGKRPSATGLGSEKAFCYIDDTTFVPVDTSEIPSGYVSVPVELDDNGKEYKTEMVAGVVGITASSSGEFIDESGTHSYVDWEGTHVKMQPEVGVTTGLDSIQPVSGWWMYELN